jgi:NAD(P)-dependent dehydrogenase (short-subunit alcohol dehydrogenase family)
MGAEQSRRLAVVTGASSGIGFELAKVFAGAFKNKVQVAAGRVVPDSLKAEKHRDMAEPGTGMGE